MSQSIQALLAQAKTEYDNKNYSEAIIHLKESLLIKEDHMPTYYHLSAVYKKLGNSQGVIKSLKRAVEIDAQPASLFDLGVEYLNVKNYPFAKKAIYKALSLENTNSSLYTLLGAVYKAEGEIDNALKCYKKAVKLEPKNRALYDVLGKFYKEQGNSDLAEKCFELGKSF